MIDFHKIKYMTELELQQYLLREFPQENARCEWKEFKNLKNSFCGDEKEMLTLWLADKILDAVGDDELSKDAIIVAQEHIEAS